MWVHSKHMSFKNKELSPAEGRRGVVVGKAREIPNVIRIQ